MTGHPEVDRILVRAQQYRNDVYAATGHPPEQFMVTEREHRLLQKYYGGLEAVDSNHEMQIFGMKVCRLERKAWYRDNRYMEHFKMPTMLPRAFQVCDPTPCFSDSQDRCRTDLPPTPQREVSCPCGEVIWDMSTCTALWQIREPRWSPLARIVAAMSAYVPLSEPDHEEWPEQHDPLSPLDDLDEGLTCCGRKHTTFAEFMAHRRQHGEG